jgi:hypothetical protein
MFAAVLEFGDSLSGFTINAQNVAIPDDASKGDFYGVQRAANAYHKKFMPQDAPIKVDGKIGRATVLAVNTAFTNLRERTGARQTFFDVESLAAAAHATAIKLASAAGVRANFTVPSTTTPPPPGPQPEFPSPVGPPPPVGTAPPIAPDATTPPPETPPPKPMSTGVKVAIGVGVGVVGLAILVRLAGR